MEEAKDYKKYLKGLKQSTRKKGKSKKGERPIVGILGIRSLIKRKRGGDTPGLKDYVKKSGQNDAFKKALAKQMNNRGFKNARIIGTNANGLIRVALSSFYSEEEAEIAILEIRKKLSSVWILNEFN